MRFRNAIEFAVPSSTKLFHVTNHDQLDPYSSIRSGSGIVPTSDVAISFLSPPSASSALYVALNGYRMRQRASISLPPKGILTPWSPGVDGYESYASTSTVASPGYQSAATEFQIQTKLLSLW